MDENGSNHKNKAPIRLTLYDPETNEVLSEHSRIFVPWAVLKKAVRVMQMNRNEMTEDDIDAIAGIVCETFGNKFSTSDLDKGADLEEMLAVVDTIIVRANLGQKGGRQVSKNDPLPKAAEKLPKILQQE